MTSVNELLARRIYGRTADEAREASECIRCRRFINPLALEPRDLAEYRITALCPACWDDIFAEDPA